MHSSSLALALLGTLFWVRLLRSGDVKFVLEAGRKGTCAHCHGPHFGKHCKDFGCPPAWRQERQRHRDELEKRMAEIAALEARVRELSEAEAKLQQRLSEAEAQWRAEVREVVREEAAAALTREDEQEAEVEAVYASRAEWLKKPPPQFPEEDLESFLDRHGLVQDGPVVNGVSVGPCVGLNDFAKVCGAAPEDPERQHHEHRRKEGEGAAFRTASEVNRRKQNAQGWVRGVEEWYRAEKQVTLEIVQLGEKKAKGLKMETFLSIFAAAD